VPWNSSIRLVRNEVIGLFDVYKNEVWLNTKIQLPWNGNKYVCNGSFIALLLTCVYAVIFITSVIGNISTCLVIRRNRHMHTTTNLYLVNLAVADVFITILGKLYFGIQSFASQSETWQRRPIEFFIFHSICICFKRNNWQYSTFNL
jgi:hypothetical protein